MDIFSQEIHTSLKKHADAVHPRAMGGAGGSAAVGAMHHRPRLPPAHRGPLESVSAQHRTHQTSVCAAGKIQTTR